MKQYIIEISQLLKDPKHWTQHTAARADDGYPVAATVSCAVCWCLVGAVEKVVPPLDEIQQSVFTFLQEEVELFSGNMSLSIFNDSNTHEEVMKFLDFAISHTTS